MADNNGGITSPEGVLMLLVAIFFDLLSVALTIIGLFTVGLGWVADLILDLLPIFIIGGWALIRGIWSGDKGTGEIKEYAQEISSNISSKIKQSKKNLETKAVEKSVAKTGAKRFGIALIGELIPIIGALPMWTWFVYKEMGGINVSQNASEDSNSESNNENKSETSLPDSQNEIISTDIPSNAKIQSQPTSPKTPAKK